jgi:bidirectional [NiFe] hydrogenase diaphorase subunit
VVEITGSNKLAPACTTRIGEGMEVTAHNDRLLEYRRVIIEMLFVERNHVCAVCVANNHCELQDMALEHGLTHFDLPPISPVLGIDASHRLFAIDHNRCILCLRCVRVCDQIEGAHTWDVMQRGIETRVVTDMGKPWGESTTCTSCGKCVQVCPTGALFEKGRAVARGSKTKRPYLPYLKVVSEERGL